MPGRLHIIPDALIRLLSDIEGQPVPQNPRLVAICGNVPPDLPFKSPFPAEYEIDDARQLGDVDRVHDEKELMITPGPNLTGTDRETEAWEKKTRTGGIHHILVTPTGDASMVCSRATPARSASSTFEPCE